MKSPRHVPPLPAHETRRVRIEGQDEGDDDDERHRLESPRNCATRVNLQPIAPHLQSFKRLQTLEQLARIHVQEMATGDFVARSAARWAKFQETPEDRDSIHALTIARNSSALVLQCAWRRWSAQLLRARRIQLIWQRQLDAASWITSHWSTSLYGFMIALEDRDKGLLQLRFEVNLKEVDALPLDSCGMHYHLPALLVAGWLRFMNARAQGTFLRRSPTILRTVDLPVHKTWKNMRELWRKLNHRAALCLQCSYRCYVARTIFKAHQLAKLRALSTIRLQCFFRVCLAQRTAQWLLTRRCAIRIQCCWRCRQARKRYFGRRVVRYATNVWLNVANVSISRAAKVIILAAVICIQTQYRARRDRALFRSLRGRHEQMQWQRNPSKGYMCFRNKMYYQAALHLENCVRQEIIEGFQPNEVVAEFDKKATDMNEAIDHKEATRRQAYTIPNMSGSFHFSTATTNTRVNSILRPSTGYQGKRLARDQFEFWHTYALSHFYVYDATGDAYNLRQACTGFKNGLILCPSNMDSTNTDSASFLLALHARFRLIQCLFWSGNEQSRSDLNGNAENMIENLSSCNMEDTSTNQYLDDWRIQLLLISSMLYYEVHDYRQSAAQLEHVLECLPHPAYSILEIQFTLALLYLKICEEADKIDEKQILLSRAKDLLKRCYQEIELWPAVGFYHGGLTSEAASDLLESSPKGSFLLHHTQDATANSTSGGMVNDWRSDQDHDHLFLKVKLDDDPIRITSLRVNFDNVQRLYSTKKIPNSATFSIHEFVSGLPDIAGINMKNGIRKELYVASLRRRLSDTQPGYMEQKQDQRRTLLSWSSWLKRIMSSSGGRRNLCNESWSAACFEMAKILENSELWVFSEFVARDGLIWSRNRLRRAQLQLIGAKVSLHMQNRIKNAQYIHRAYVELDLLTPGVRSLVDRNLVSVQHAWSLNCSLSKRESFFGVLERMQKLERMSLKAWRFDSLSESFRGDPFYEALLLQRIDDEAYSECGDAYFIRSLLKAHVRAYAMNGFAFEIAHLQLSMKCVERLFRRLHDAGSDGSEFSLLINHVANAPHKRSFSLLQEKKRFRVEVLLLSWYRFPFLVCYEIADVFYRLYVHHEGTYFCNAVIDIYESLYGRLRSMRPSNGAYISYQELILFRLAFLYAQKAHITYEDHWLQTTIAFFDEVLVSRDHRRIKIVQQPNAILWPVPLKLPLKWTGAEVRFVRGLFREKMDQQHQTASATTQAKWQDYQPLHQQLMKLVLEDKERTSAHVSHHVQAQPNLRGVRMFLGATRGVVLHNVLHSKPYISIQAERKNYTTQTQPIWTNLSPDWDEIIEMDIVSPHARVIVILKDRGNKQHGGDDQVLGTVEIFLADVIAHRETHSAGKYYDLKPNHSSHDVTMQPKHHSSSTFPRIFIRIDLMLQAAGKPKTHSRSQKKKRVGNWDIDFLHMHLHGDLETFVASRWIWSSLATMWLEEKDFFIARWLLEKAVAIVVDDTQLTSDELSEYVTKDLIGLCVCYKATLGFHWLQFAYPYIQRAEVILNAMTAGGDNSVTILKCMNLIHAWNAEALASEMYGPLESALAKKTPASSQWVQFRHRSTASTQTTSSNTTYFFNIDTSERASSSEKLKQPLEYEDEEELMRLSTDTGSGTHRILIMKTDMRARVAYYHADIQHRLEQDPYQWIAVFNDRKQEMHYFSQRASDRDDDDTMCVWTSPKQPPSYVLFANEFMLYHVLVVQDAYRKYLARRKRRRRLRGLLHSVGWLTRELLAARTRLALRAESERKSSLNCLHVVVEKARRLRTGDIILSDPFVVLALIDAKGELVVSGKTSVRLNTLNPNWSEEFFLPYHYSAHAQKDLLNDGSDQNVTAWADSRVLFRVYDYDAISGENVRQSEGEHEESLSFDLLEQIGAKDFLGLAFVVLDSLVHGRCVTADLQLGDKDGYESLRSRGTLTVTMQWINYADGNSNPFGSSNTKRRTVEPKKRSRPKPTIIGGLEQEKTDVHSRIGNMMQQLFDIGVTMLDPLQKLCKRLSDAQEAGMTADEAKLIEQRINAFVQVPFQQKISLLKDDIASCSACVVHIYAQLGEHIDQYIDSQDDDTMANLTQIRNTCVTALGTAEKHSSDAIFGSCGPSFDSNSALTAIDSVLRCRHLLLDWHQCLALIFDTFFVSSNMWHHPIEAKLSELYDRLDVQRGLDTDKLLISRIHSTQPAEARAEGIALSSKIAVNKRMERIQKEKRGPMIGRKQNRKAV